MSEGSEDPERLDLIEQISTATNQQTAVTNDDRKSNDRIQLEIQKVVFDRYRLLYERKAGELGDSRQNGYITTDQIVDRNVFLRIYFTISGDFGHKSLRRAFARFTRFDEIPNDLPALDKFYWGYRCYTQLRKRDERAGRSAQRLLMGKVYAAVRTTMPRNVGDLNIDVRKMMVEFEDKWAEFILHAARTNKKWIRTYKDKATGQTRTEFYEKGWRDSGEFVEDVKAYFGQPRQEQQDDGSRSA